MSNSGPGVALVLGGVVSLEGGAVLAALLIPTAGITGTVTLRLCFGVLVLLAYTLQADALRRMPRGLFSILTSTEPAAGAILGLLALGQRITLLQWAGIVAVVIASIGAARTHRVREADRPV